MTRPAIVIGVSPDDDDDVFACDAEDLFDVCGIHVASYQEMLLVAVLDDEVVGALTLGAPHGDPWLGMWFSVVVHPDHRRGGVGRMLVQACIAHCEEHGFPCEAHVVNEEAMVPLLEDLGFSQEGPIWSY